MPAEARSKTELYVRQHVANGLGNLGDCFESRLATESMTCVHVDYWSDALRMLRSLLVIVSDEH